MKRHSTRLSAELLEHRHLLSASPTIFPSTFASKFYSLDGTDNNLANGDWGSAGSNLLRIAAAEYTDGISSPAGTTRPNPRDISNTLAAHPEEDIKNDRALTALIYAWGQFIDHDLDLTPNADPRDPLHIAVPADDLLFDPKGTGKVTIPLNRSAFDPETGDEVGDPRQQINVLTAWLDGSMIYGSDLDRARALRTLEDGKLKTSEGNLLPLNADKLPNANDAHIVKDEELFLAGDVRANENIELTSLHTLFMREHNRVAELIAGSNANLGDEQIYQLARRWVIAEIQSITYNEFLPALLGPAAPGPYRGYSPYVNAGIANEFSTAAFRVGHTLLGNDVEFLDNDGEEIREELPLAEAFFNPQVVHETDIDPILKYLASDLAEEVDTRVVDGVRNFLFGPPGAGGLDLPAINIQRGREHGLADFNATREAYGLPKLTRFSQITSDPVLRQQLKDLYGSVNNVDLWVGGIAEDHIAGSSVGPTFARIIADQFSRLRNGDRLWYERTFRGAELARIESTTLGDVIAQNTSITTLQENVFYDPTALYYNAEHGSSDVTVVVDGDSVDIIDRLRGTLLATMAVDAITRVIIDGADDTALRVGVDLSEAGDTLPETIVVNGGWGWGDTLTVLPTSDADTVVVDGNTVTLNDQTMEFSDVEILNVKLDSLLDRVRVVSRPDARLVVTNLAFGHYPGGGWQHGSGPRRR